MCVSSLLPVTFILVTVKVMKKKEEGEVRGRNVDGELLMITNSNLSSLPFDFTTLHELIV